MEEERMIVAIAKQGRSPMDPPFNKICILVCASNFSTLAFPKDVLNNRVRAVENNEETIIKPTLIDP